MCDLEIAQDAYLDAETVALDRFRIAVSDSGPAKIEWKVWSTNPVTPPQSIINLGTGRLLSIPASTDVDLGPLPLFQVPPGLARGRYSYGCRLLDPVTGEAYSTGEVWFQIR